MTRGSTFGREYLVLLLVLVLFGAGCGPAGSSRTDPPPPSPAATPSLAPSDAAASPSPSPFGARVTALEARSLVADLPDELGRLAWVGGWAERRPDGEIGTWHLVIGRLGRTAEIAVDLDGGGRFLSGRAVGDLAAVVVSDRQGAELLVFGPPSPEPIARLTIPNPLWDAVELDPVRRLAYLSLGRPGGDGRDVVRLDLATGRLTTLLAFEEAAMPIIPTENAGFVLTPSGDLVGLACPEARPCRLWRIGPAELAGEPLELPVAVPVLCSLVGASDRTLVVYDAAACTDVGGEPLPLRAVDLADGASVLLAADLEGAGRVVAAGDRELVVAAVRSRDWRTTRIVGLDLGSGERSVLLEGVANPGGETGWYVVGREILPGSWVTVRPSGDFGGPPPVGGYLVDVASGEVIELPQGSIGWD